MANNIGVICAHPDDEVLGCGGTMARLADAGHQVHILVLAEGATSRDVRRDVEHRSAELGRLREAAAAAARVLGAASVTFGEFPDNRMDAVDLLDVVKYVEAFLFEKQIGTVMTHHGADLNLDHQIVFRAALTASRPLPGGQVHTFLSFEVPSSSEWSSPSIAVPFHPTWYEDIDLTFERKLQALRCYETEMRAWPHPRSYEGVEALARWRGVSVGKRAVEAFELIRRIRQ